MRDKFKSVVAAALMTVVAAVAFAQGNDTSYQLIDSGDGIATTRSQFVIAPISASQAQSEPLTRAFVTYARTQAISNEAAQEADRAWQELRLELEKYGLFE